MVRYRQEFRLPVDIGSGSSGKDQGFKPSGKEITAGLWKGISSVVEKTTRIITPVFIGSNTTNRKERETRRANNDRVPTVKSARVDLSNVFVGDYTRIKTDSKVKTYSSLPTFS